MLTVAALLCLVYIPIAACSSNPAATDAPTQPVSSASAATSPAITSRTMTVTGNGRTVSLTVELAYTEAQRERGLMSREHLADDAGMLFVFAANTDIGFWMKDTLIPLDIAYLDAIGHVLEIKHGKPLDETVLTPSRQYRYTLEVAGGWFERHGLAVGATVALPTDLPAAE
jgi:uncharacterized protein